MAGAGMSRIDLERGLKFSYCVFETTLVAVCYANVFVYFGAFRLAQE